jgi:hypothetical protein
MAETKNYENPKGISSIHSATVAAFPTIDGHQALQEISGDGSEQILEGSVACGSNASTISLLASIQLRNTARRANYLHKGNTLKAD